MALSQVLHVRLLDAGYHAHPHRGGCLLEMVSTLPGGPWTDHPRGVATIVGVLARAVNDATSAAQRPALAPLIPWLACLPRTTRADADAIVAATAAAAAMPMARADTARLLRAEATAAGRTVTATGLIGWFARRAQRRAAVEVVSLALHVLRHAEGETALRRLLIETINELRLAHTLSPMPPMTRPAEACQTLVAVRSELRAPHGAESTYHHCTALIEFWPDWLRDPWTDLTNNSGCTRAIPRRSGSPWTATRTS